MAQPQFTPRRIGNIASVGPTGKKAVRHARVDDELSDLRVPRTYPVLLSGLRSVQCRCSSEVFTGQSAITSTRPSGLRVREYQELASVGDPCGGFGDLAIEEPAIVEEILVESQQVEARIVGQTMTGVAEDQGSDWSRDQQLAITDSQK